jgi:hypothetical protein
MPRALRSAVDSRGATFADEHECSYESEQHDPQAERNGDEDVRIHDAAGAARNGW